MADVGSLSSLCPDGRLIVTGNGALFHPYPMDVPVDMVAVVRALQAHLTDDALLAVFEERYVDLHGNAHREPLLRQRLEKLRG